MVDLFPSALNDGGMSIHLLGLPTDINSSFLRGPAKAPRLIREALFSDRGNQASELGLELGHDIDLVDEGDLVLAETPADFELISSRVSAIAANGGIPICLGGDHAVTFPIIRGLAAHHGPITILHFDAHPDLYDDFEGNPLSHASPFARIMEGGLATRLVQIGIRTLNQHCRAQAARFGVEIIEMRDFAVDKVPVFTTPFYVSLDLDALDPSQMPGVSHPEPGGLFVRDILKVLDRQTAPMIGADIVEFNPNEAQGPLSAVTAAKFVKELAALATRTQGNGAA
ncbi:MAG: hypothetical protein RL764_123 [Pseudomonadota bacterium]